MGYTRKIDIRAAAGIKNKKTFVLSIEILCGLILLGDIIINLLLDTFYFIFLILSINQWGLSILKLNPHISPYLTIPY